MTKQAQSVKKETVVDPVQPDERTFGPHIALFEPLVMKIIMESLDEAILQFREMSNNVLRPRDRRRRVGAGTRIYGFIDKVSDLVVAWPQFATLLNAPSLKNCLRNIEDCRTIISTLGGLERSVRDSMMTYSDEAFAMALIFYNSVRELSRRGDPDAREVFNMLRPFFRKRRSATGEQEPTEPEVERDVRALLHGTKEGKVVIENEKPRMTKGKRIVVDETTKKKGAWKETEKGEIV